MVHALAGGTLRVRVGKIAKGVDKLEGVGHPTAHEDLRGIREEGDGGDDGRKAAVTSATLLPETEQLVKVGDPAPSAE